MQDVSNPDSSSAGSGETRRDIQRAALRDLVALSTDCAATEAQIEQRHSSEMEGAAKELEKSSWAIEQRFKSLMDQVQQKATERLAEIVSRYDTEAGQLREADERARLRIEHEHDSITREVKQKYDQATWLADSVFDVARNRVRVAFAQAKEQVDKHLEWVGQMQQQAGELMVRYHQKAAAVVDPPGSSLLPGEDQAPVLQSRREQIEGGLAKLAALKAPALFVGATPYVALGLLLIVAGAIAQWATGSNQAEWATIGITLGVTAVVLVGGGIALWSMAKSQIAAVAGPLYEAIAAFRRSAKISLKNASKQQSDDHAQAVLQHQDELQGAKNKYSPSLFKASRNRDSALAATQGESSKQLGRLESHRDRNRSETEEWQRRHLAELDEKCQQELGAARQRHDLRIAEAQREYEQGRMELQRRWTGGLARIEAPMARNDGGNGQVAIDWADPAWRNWTPPRRFASQIRFGQLQVDLKRVTDRVPQQLALPESFTLPAILAFPRQSSLLIHTDREGRPEAIATMQMAMARLLTGLPPGRVRFTIIDPIGLGQNFAGFMHLADHDEALVGGRIWTEAEHIEQRLTDLTEHMETVIQKYLRNEFETIDDYNAQAGELAEPYRFLVVADLPVGFSGDAMRRLNSIASSGARCGVYTLIIRDTRLPLPAGSHMDEVEANSVNLVREGGRFLWKDDVFRQFPLTLDPPPAEELLTPILEVVGKNARELKRVEVPFETIAPTAQQFWSGSTSADLEVPIGRRGATRLQMLKLGRGVQQHVLIAGKTGSGKSTLLHALITNLAMWYHPSEVEFYLIDFKKGVEFKTYSTHVLPHARAIAVESDREFGLSVLHRLDGELTRRGTLFRKLGVQDLPAYRQASGQSMPRTLLIIDEFQEFFSEDDKLAQDAGQLLDRLVRQGRAFGIHVLLGSQTIGGTSGLARSTIGQMAVRIALQCSEADSQLILGDNNSAARLLSRPGEAIYNDAGGLVESNSPFQIAWLPDEQREQYLARVRQRAESEAYQAASPIVFEGNAPAPIAKNLRLARLLEANDWPPSTLTPLAWLGEPVAIKEPTAVALRRQSGANILVVGQQEESAMAIMAAAMVSLAAQHPRQAARFVVLDGSAADSPLAKVFPQLKAAIPHEMQLVEYRAVAEAMAALAAEMQKRQASDEADAPAIYLLVYALQRYRVLRRQEESFSFSPDEQKKGAPPDKLFADLLRDGPPLGIHTIAWCDTPAAVERTLDRTSLREFDHRVLFQMSASDSSNLIDSPLANKLGYHRALAYSEEQGTVEKFRPYALLDAAWLGRIKEKWQSRA